MAAVKKLKKARNTNKYYSVIKPILWSLLAIVIFTAGIIYYADYKVNAASDGAVYNDISKIPHNKVGLLLGTSKHKRGGSINNYFKNRIKTAVDLLRAGKIDYIVVSGDNGKEYYNEPRDMKQALMNEGIAEDKIYLDFAGFSTYDSVIRLNKIFGQNSFTIISQEFHNRRAIFIAKSAGMKAVGVNAKDISFKHGYKTLIRELFARVKVLIDVSFMHKPKFLGEKINIK